MSCDRAHVPDHRALGVDIESGDEQAAAAAMFGGDVRKQRGRDLFGDLIAQRPGIDEALAAAAGFENVGRGDLGIFVTQRFVVARARKYEWRHERAAAHAGDHRVIGSLAGRAQPREQARAERAVRAAAGEREPGARLRRQRILVVGLGIRPEPRVLHAGDGRGGVFGGSVGDARRRLFRVGGRGRRRRARRGLFGFGFHNGKGPRANGDRRAQALRWRRGRAGEEKRCCEHRGSTEGRSAGQHHCHCG